MVNGTTLQITTKFLVKFFDWDRAYCEYLGPNKFLELSDIAKMSHQFNRKRTKQDFYQILCFLKKYDQIWHVVKSILSILPPENFEYIFPVRNEKMEYLSSFKIRKFSELQHYMEKRPNFWKKDSDKIYWTELEVSFIKTMQDGQYILNEFSRVYPNKNYNELDSIFLGLQFIDDENYVYDLSEGSLVLCSFVSGWFCQSFFDVKDEILKPVNFFLNLPHFQNFFKPTEKPQNDQIYKFPTYKPEQKPCKF